ncbi:MAG TPA: SDR family NAD(P)-dependent oxidoreductase [Candidatus Acidoferrum sp.]|nr:SDR family NAD(P)-dependent oxidoreductase [Candidatus Acidoferrum sp.]
MSNRLQNKVVLITGAAQGIGFACAQQCAAEGATVILADIQQERGEKSAAALRNEGHRAYFHAVDVRDESQCAALIDHTFSAHKKLDGLVNNAGWFPRATLEQTTTDLWEQVLNVNLRSAFYVCKYAVPRMRQARAGSIVNMGSICGIQSLPNLIAYGAAKGGLLCLTRTLAGALAEHRIRVNYVIPGWIFTEGEIAIQKGEGRTPEDLRQAGEKLAFGRAQSPQETAYAVVYLLSDESAQVTGTTMHLDAGASTLPIQPGTYPG